MVQDTSRQICGKDYPTNWKILPQGFHKLMKKMIVRKAI